MGKPFLLMATSSAIPAMSLWVCVGRSFRCVPAPLEVKVGGGEAGGQPCSLRSRVLQVTLEGDWMLAEKMGFGKSPGMGLSLIQQNH